MSQAAAAAIFNWSWAVAIMFYSATMWKWGHRALSLLCWLWAVTQMYRATAWTIVAIPNRTERVGPLLEPVAWFLALVPTVAFWAAYRWMRTAYKRRLDFVERLTK